MQAPTENITVPIDIQEAEAQRVKIWQEIDRAEKELKEKLARNAKVKEAREKIEDLDVLIEEKSKVLIACNDSENKLASLKLKIKEANEVLNELNLKSFNQNTELEKHEKDYDAKKKDLIQKNELLVGCNDSMRKEIDVLKAYLKDLKEQILKYEEKSKVAETEFNKISTELGLKQAELRTIDVVTRNKRTIQGECEKKIELLEVGIKALEDVLSRREEEVESGIPARRAAFEAEMAEKVREFDQKNGELTERENWLEEKTGQLRTVKQELEKHFNRKFNNIVI